jgi:molybdate transport system ATP-binding protein
VTIALHLAGRIGPDFTLDIACDLPGSGVTALLGQSGSGKTTLLRALAGLERVPGTIRFDETVWQDARSFMPPHRRRVGYVFQGAGLLAHLTVAQNLDYAAKRAAPGPIDRARIIARTGIAPLLDRLPARLSGGEAQRAAIARALLSQPRLLLMDEPLSALDTTARSQLLKHLAVLLPELAIPVVYVTHDEAEARRIARHVVRIDGGRVVSEGPSG